MLKIKVKRSNVYYFIFTFLTLIFPFTGVAQEMPAASSLTEKTTAFLDKEIERIGEMDLYGSSAMLPKGYLSVKYEFTHLNVNKRFDAYGNKTKAIPTIEFTQGSKKHLALDLGLSGSGGSHTFQVSYGLTDPLDWYIEIPYQYMTVRMDPRLHPIDENGNKISSQLASLFNIKDTQSITGKEFLCLFPEAVGRPVPETYYKASWALGDINTGFSWNYFRTRHLSAAITPRVFFPTGKLADPDSSLIFATGSQIDTGTGGWGVSATQTYDLRIIKPNWWNDVIFSTEFTAGYTFEHERDYPSNFTAPNSVISSILDPAGEFFPDLSELKGTYKYTSGFSMDWTNKLDIQLAILNIGFGYGVAFAQKPVIEGDPSFVSMVNGLELLEKTTVHTLEIGGGISLIPLYIPANIAFSYIKMMAGSNSLIYDDYIKITLQIYSPVFP